MNTLNRFEVEQYARELRRREMSRLANAAFAALSQTLREHHEAWLRRKQCNKHVAAAIGTPA